MTAATKEARPTLRSGVWPGLVLCAGLATLGFSVGHSGWAQHTLHLSPLMLVILAGMVWRAIAGLPGGVVPGVQVAKKSFLRWAVAGLGFRLSLAELW